MADPWPTPTVRVRTGPTELTVERWEEDGYRPALTLRVPPPEVTVALLSNGDVAAIVGRLIFLSGKAWRGVGTPDRWRCGPPTIRPSSSNGSRRSTASRERALARLPSASELGCDGEADRDRGDRGHPDRVV
ncbi:hypothetical protein [Methanopyrus kandleri]